MREDYTAEIEEGLIYFGIHNGYAWLELNIEEAHALVVKLEGLISKLREES